MRNVLISIGDRYHPLFHLRKHRFFQLASRWLDIPIRIRIPSITHPVYVSFSKNLSLLLSGGEYGEQSERQHFTTLIGTGKFQRFLDIGANIGIYGFSFRSLMENAEVTLIEPDLHNAALLHRTITTAKIGNVRVIEVAVSDTNGAATFYQDELTGSTGSIVYDENGSFVFRHHRHVPTFAQVNCLTLDSLFASGNDDPDLIKIDAEGAELGIFRGALALLKRSHPAIIFECDTDQPLVTALLSGIGYEFFDFSTMDHVEIASHNCLALHSDHHADIVQAAHINPMLN